MKIQNLQKFLLLIICAFAGDFIQADATQAAQEQILAPGYGNLQFTAPEPGTYTLPVLGAAADGTVLDSQGKTITLHSLMGDKVVLLSFIYSTCSDVNGCPLATSVLHKIKNRLKKEPELAGKLRLVTLSFNPEHDTPEMMQRYGQELQGKGVEWRFLTTRSELELKPILDHYKQNIQKVYDAQGKFTGTFSHILRVYLIDKNKQLRNIYSVAFLHADTLINDIKTLLQTETKQAVSHAGEKKSAASTSSLYSAGDNKSNYEQPAYQTKSIALTDRIGQATNLLKTVKNPPLGLPAVPVPCRKTIH